VPNHLRYFTHHLLPYTFPFQKYGNEIVIFDAKHHATDLQTAMSIPFGFFIPSAQRHLPPSFEGGERPGFLRQGRSDVLGRGLCEIVCMSSFSSGEGRARSAYIGYLSNA
jgi:hypothetical protein